MPTPYPGDPQAASDITFARYRSYVNPGMADLLKFTGFEYPEWEAEGCIVRDIAGNEYIDCVAGYGVFSLGHRHPDVLRAVREQMDRITLKTHYFLSEGLGLLAEMLAGIAPGPLHYTFVCNSGTEAVEGALKAARVHTGRPNVVGTVNGYHGKTYGSLSASGREVYKAPFTPLLEGFSTVPFADANAAHQAVDEHTAAFIVEVVQGEGGINIAPKGYLASLREITREAGALLIVDEVRTGFGRTGRMFACEHDGVEPDILTLAKALGGGVMPIGAFMGTEEVWDSLFSENPYLHTSTFGGNPLACAAGIAAVEATQRLKLPERSAELGGYMLCRLAELKDRFPEFISDVRGLGLLAGLEFASEDFAKLVIAACATERLLVAYSLNNPKVIRIEPPLIIERELLDRAIGIIETAISETADLLRSLGELPA